MGAYHTDAVIQPNGTLVLQNLPYPEGQTVEIILVERPRAASTDEPLAGTPVTYVDPFRPVAGNDWDAVA